MKRLSYLLMVLAVLFVTTAPAIAANLVSGAGVTRPSVDGCWLGDLWRLLTKAWEIVIVGVEGLPWP